MSTKSDLLKEISKKAQKIKDLKEKTASPKDAFNFALEFFKEVDELNALEIKQEWRDTFAIGAFARLRNQLKTIDEKIEVNLASDDQGNITGIDIVWSDAYAAKHSIDKNQHIDVTEVLLSL